MSGNYDASIVTNEKYKSEFLKILSGEKILNINENVVALSAKYPKEFQMIPGTLHQMIRILAWENINILELVETLTESIFILSEDDAMRAFKALQSLLRS